jgi:hypothetical protein
MTAYRWAFLRPIPEDSSLSRLAKLDVEEESLWLALLAAALGGR